MSGKPNTTFNRNSCILELNNRLTDKTLYFFIKLNLKTNNEFSQKINGINKDTKIVTVIEETP